MSTKWANELIPKGEFGEQQVFLVKAGWNSKQLKICFYQVYFPIPVILYPIKYFYLLLIKK